MFEWLDRVQVCGRLLMLDVHFILVVFSHRFFLFLAFDLSRMTKGVSIILMNCINLQMLDIKTTLSLNQS